METPLDQKNHMEPARMPSGSNTLCLGCVYRFVPKKTRIYRGGYQMENLINPIIDHPLNHHK